MQRKYGHHHHHGGHHHSLSSSNIQQDPYQQVYPDTLDRQLHENVALLCLDKNFVTAENTALYALSDLLKTYIQEVGKEIKGYTELNGRTDSNMIDALNAMFNYDMNKQKMQEHIKSKELTYSPQTQGHLREYEAVLERRVTNKIDALQQTFSNTDVAFLDNSLVPGSTGAHPIPDQIKKLKTFSSIPAHLHHLLPSHLEFNVDPTPVEQESNPSHERIKRVQFKREIENSLQKVADNTVTDVTQVDVTAIAQEEKKGEESDVMMIDTRAPETKRAEEQMEQEIAMQMEQQQAEISQKIMQESTVIVPVGDQFTGSGHIIKNNLDQLFF
ncbi:hypothetical protein FGO68_gene10207 [Halteria grandinella]|uniref:Bromodomain associated domain-containing protein n=1 Tax=Halteria grandinella TaxID=5974 RepID=A0A8J8NP01_HALGN|nr:hypothetical protein FGO68_gene10207 [Halteria grandinella]